MITVNGSIWYLKFDILDISEDEDADQVDKVDKGLYNFYHS